MSNGTNGLRDREEEGKGGEGRGGGRMGRTGGGFVFLAMLFLAWQQPIHCTTDQGDVSALQNLLIALNSPLLSGWNASGGDPCAESWQGVTCVGSSVTEIHLPGLQLGGYLGWALNQFASLTVLDLSNNQIGRTIPWMLPPVIETLLLQNNQLTGSISYSFKFLTDLKEVRLANNQLSGQIPDVFGDLGLLETIDLSVNNLSSSIPSSFSNLSSLSSLYLQNNQLDGGLDYLTSLPLNNLDIANNAFTGWIPSKLTSIPNFQYGGNQFSNTPAPPPPPFVAPPPPPPARSPPHKSPPTPKSKSSEGKSSSNFWTGGRVAGIAIATILAIIAAVLIVLVVRWKKRDENVDEEKDGAGGSWWGPLIPPATKDNSTTTSDQISIEKDSEKEEKRITEDLRGQVPWPRKKRVESSPPEKTLKPPPSARYSTPPPGPPERRPPFVIAATAYTFAELQAATKELLGDGSLGRVCRGEVTFPTRQVVAIKKLESTAPTVENEEEFLRFVASIARLRHSNITELIGYCSDAGNRILVYQYLSGGTLQERLHNPDKSSRPLSWNMRLKIALGAARALEYLHEVCLPPVFHQNVKSANILLNEDMNPHVSDCGLAALSSFGTHSQKSLQLHGSFGYSAPEYSNEGIYTAKSDVFSFGCVMLELMTGRKPLDNSRPRTEWSLVKWATPQLGDIDALERMVDPALNGIYPARSLSRYANIVSSCVQTHPEFRPPMSEVVQSLVRLMQRASLSKRRSGDDLGASQRSVDRDRDFAERLSQT